MNLAEVQAHQKHHGFKLIENGKPVSEFKKLPKPRLNKTETAYAQLLEAQKRRGDIVDYRFEGMSLAWGADPLTGKPMHYKPDFVVIETTANMTSPHRLMFVEVKGAHIFDRDLVRFKGCRAEWPMFRFEMHQKKAGEWKRIL